MKNYNRLFYSAILLYLLLAVSAGWLIFQTEEDNQKLYNVEINRIYQSLSEGNIPDRLALRSYDYIKEVSFVDAKLMDDRQTLQPFFESKNNLESQIMPLYEKEVLTGFLRFDYERKDWNRSRIMWITQVFLGAMGLYLFIILLYLKWKLIKPFANMSRLPYELAKGHLKGAVKEEKSRYFGEFLWGIGQLKDTLDISKKRQLELEKEKKLLLLSLSHDIKTPLNTIKLYAKALEQNLFQNEEQTFHAIHQIMNKSDEIELYVEEIMKNSREDLLDIHVSAGEFYLHDLLKKLRDTYEEMFANRLLEFTIDKVPNRLLKGDLERAVEVLENIFENALKYGDGRRIALTFYEEDYCQVIRIFNTGVLVTDNEFNHIFDSFFRASNSCGIQGNGLGLYICQEIMRKMGGEVFAQRETDGMAFLVVFL